MFLFIHSDTSVMEVIVVLTHRLNLPGGSENLRTPFYQRGL
jgi:hypothetical protein